MGPEKQQSTDKNASVFPVKAPSVPENKLIVVEDIKIRKGQWINKGQLMLVLKISNKELPDQSSKTRIKAESSGKVVEVCIRKGENTVPNNILARISLTSCPHSTLMKNMCADCGADLELEEQNQDKKSKIAMIHSIPELKISTDEAESLGREDERRLLANRRLVLLVDLDQTLIHTTNDNIPANIHDVQHFQLGGPQSPWYHTRIRPKTSQFLKNISKYYELHIFTYGARLYAHTVAKFLDQDSQLFSHRILSRDECFDSRLKTANLPSLFPCGDHMVCIIDDREDVWGYAPNLVHVKPYVFFKNAGDINAPEKFNGGSQNKTKVDSKAQAKKDVESQSNNVQKTVNPSTEKESKGELDLKPTENNPKHDISKHERRDSIDMPTFGGTDSSQKGEDKLKDVEMESTASFVSDDLEMSDDNGSNSCSSSGSSDVEIDKNTKSDQELKDTYSTQAKDEKVKTEENSPHPVKSSVISTQIKPDCPSKEGKENNLDSKLHTNSGETENIDKAKDISSPTTTDDSDASAKSGIENDGDEFKVKKNDDSKEKEKTAIEDDLFDVEDTDDYLLYLEDTLKNIHTAYYKEYDQMKGSGKTPDLKEVIPNVKRLSLKGTSIVFSGVVPTNIPLGRSKPYLVAKSLGAEVTDKIYRKTTHLVAARTGTAKVNEAKKRAKNVHLVTPDWLWCCAERWERIDERLYPLYKSAPITVKPPAHCSSPEDNASDRMADMDASNFDFSGRPKIAERQLSSESLQESINPFFTLSTEDFKGMEKEIEDESSMSSSSDEDEIKRNNSTKKLKPGIKNKKVSESEKAHLSDSSNSDAESLTGEYPRGMKRKHGPDDPGSEGDDEDEFGETEGPRDGDALERFRQGGMIPDDFEIEQASDDDDGYDGEEDRAMAEQLEREFMEGEDSLSNSNF